MGTIMKSLKTKSSCGHDLLPVKILKLVHLSSFP
jgi:hypothetical protein